MFIQLSCVTQVEKSYKKEPKKRDILIGNISFITSINNEYRTLLNMNDGNVLYSKYNISQVREKINKVLDKL